MNNEKILKIKASVLKLTKEKRPVLILAAGLIGIVLILVSEIGSSEKSQPVKSESMIEEYEQQLTGQLTSLIEKIDGAGRTKVMLTLECGEESVYAKDSTEKSENQNNSSESEKIQQTDTNIEYEYIIIKSTGSSQDGLLLMTLKPRVRGAAVVCDGGESAIVKQQITEAVCAVLGISAAKVSVAKMTP